MGVIDIYFSTLLLFVVHAGVCLLKNWFEPRAFLRASESGGCLGVAWGLGFRGSGQVLGMPRKAVSKVVSRAVKETTCS